MDIQNIEKLDKASMQQYWQQLSSRHLSELDDGLAAICYAGMPVWFNRFLDVYQRRAMDRLTRNVDLHGSRVLDVGTGVGRWARWYANRGSIDVVGIDMDPARLKQARGLGGPVTYLEMRIDRLDFPSASFDVVNSVTVLQHVEDSIKRDAIAELARVLKPGGKAVVFEETHTADDASHVFPWPRAAWEQEFARHGLHVVRTAGEQYTPLLRLLKTAFSAWKGSRSRSEIESLKSGDGRSSGLMLPLRIAVAASYPIEEILRYLPARFAKITGFLLVKS